MIAEIQRRGRRGRRRTKQRRGRRRRRRAPVEATQLPPFSLVPCSFEGCNKYSRFEFILSNFGGTGFRSPVVLCPEHFHQYYVNLLDEEDVKREEEIRGGGEEEGEEEEGI